MILLLTLLLCATECRVHRNPYTNDSQVGIGCVIANDKQPGHIMGNRQYACVLDSHWLPCVVVEKCDTVRYILEVRMISCKLCMASTVIPMGQSAADAIQHIKHAKWCGLPK